MVFAYTVKPVMNVDRTAWAQTVSRRSETEKGEGSLRDNSYLKHRDKNNIPQINKPRHTTITVRGAYRTTREKHSNLREVRNVI
jgi:hypothetical protein